VPCRRSGACDRHRTNQWQVTVRNQVSEHQFLSERGYTLSDVFD
jgi:hypothetical protein